MAFEWNPTKENQLFESWWNNIYIPETRKSNQEFHSKIGTKQADIINSFNAQTTENVKNRFRSGGAGGGQNVPLWANYLNSYLKTEVEKSKQQAEAERVAQQAQIVQAEQDYATAAKQAEASQLQAKRISAVADFQSQQTVEQARQASALAMQSQAQPVQQRKKPQIGQPGISRTRLSSGTTVGGYGGTSAGNVSPTGLNI